MHPGGHATSIAICSFCHDVHIICLLLKTVPGRTIDYALLRCRYLMLTEHNCMAYHCGNISPRFLTKPYLCITGTKLYTSLAKSRQPTCVACDRVAPVTGVRTRSRCHGLAGAPAVRVARPCRSHRTVVGAGSSCSARSSLT